MSMVHLAAAPWGLLLCGFCLALAVRRQWWRWFGLGCGLSAAVVLPYLVYLVRTSFSDVGYILQTGTESQGLNTAAYRLANELITGLQIVANARGDLWDRSVLRWEPAAGLLQILFGIAWIWAVVVIIRKLQQRALWLFTLIWILSVPTLFLLAGIHLQHFYLLILFPAPYVLIGGWVATVTTNLRHQIWTNLWKVAGYVAAGFLLLLGLWWSSLWLVRIRLEAQGLLDRPTRGWLMDTTGETISRYLRQQPGHQVIVLTQHQGEVSPFDWLRGYAQNDAIRVVTAGHGLLIPNAPTCYMLGPGVDARVLAPVVQHTSIRDEMTIPANPPWPFWCMDSPPEVTSPLAEWVNGMALLHTGVQGDLQAGGRLDIMHTWMVQGKNLVPAHFFNHLLYEGDLVAQIDGDGVPYWYWREGDILITYFTLYLPNTMPGGTYRLRTGMYTWPGIERILRLTGEDGYDIFETAPGSLGPISLWGQIHEVKLPYRTASGSVDLHIAISKA
ncbi:MAG: hypothetical protein P1S60_16925, partial [Anaerolineae bacterium]|nr:hypothetical protein [Anaerolineae bacterium]